MVLTPLIRWQLRIFGVISVVALGLTFFVYAKVPSMVGIGVYDVHVDFADASGLYPRAQVTFHGVKVGRVVELEVSDGGAVATLRIEDGAKIPLGATAELHSTSAIGEQYVDLVTDDADGPYLEHGAEIPRERAIEMPQITPVLDSLNRLLASVPRAPTRRVLRQVGDGLGGRSDDLGGIIDSSGQLLTDAQANIEATTSLIAALQPVLSTQEDLGTSTQGYARALNDLTATLAAQNTADLRALLRTGPGGLDALTRTVGDLQPALPMFLANATTNAAVLNAYLPGLRQLLVVYPATIARLQGVANARAEFGDARFDLRASFDDPPSCQSGYLPPGQRRSPSDTTHRHVNPLAHCRIPANDPIAARGARNLPCPNSAQRGPLPESCGLTFRRGIWPDTGGTVAYDLAVGRTDRTDELDLENERGEDLWKILVLAPLSVR
ncbi:MULTISPECIES: MCE family protein [Nocardioides]|uniref:MCE family protein n=1 Tax=Nocardioides vastitatis TaxID=2568655 RepID=A0ABW0ZKI7_9ACTN|nr:MlaD family protein [Nocardioides sp.]THJ16029.1 MCE family protein [Nocardioides sp.]